MHGSPVVRTNATCSPAVQAEEASPQPEDAAQKFLQEATASTPRAKNAALARVQVGTAALAESVKSSRHVQRASTARRVLQLQLETARPDSTAQKDLQGTGTTGNALKDTTVQRAPTESYVRRASTALKRVL